MKRGKRMLILAAVLAVACLATFLLSRYEQKQEQIKNSDAIILELPAQSVTAISWRYSEGDGLGFHRAGEQWKYDEDDAFPVNADKIEAILKNYEQYGVRFVIESVEDYGQYGLDEPECTLTIETESQVYTLKMGDYSKLDDQRYIDIGDGNVYLVEDDPIEQLYTSLSYVVQHDDTPDFSTVRQISFSGTQSGVIERQEDSTHTYAPEEDIYFMEELPLDTASVRTLLNCIATLNLTDYVTYNATQEELAAFGLDEPLLTICVSYTNTDEDDNEYSGVCTLHIGENREERAASDEAVAAGESATAVTHYVRVDQSALVYTLSEYDYGVLTAVSYDDLRHAEVFWADFEKVTQMDVTLEGQTHSLIRETVPTDDEQEQAQYVWYYCAEEIEIDPIETALTALRAECFTDREATGKEELSVTLHLSDENYPAVKVQLYRVDGTSCLAVVDGQSVSLISRSDVMTLVEAIWSIVLS